MGVRRLGIQLASLLPGLSSLPGTYGDLLGLTIDAHRVSTNARFILHEGVLVSLGKSLGFSLQNFPVSIPLLSSGLRFRLALRKRSDGQTPTSFVLDIWLDRFEIAIPGVVAAKRIEPGLTSATPTHLEADPAYAAREPGQTPKPVQIVGGGILRIEKKDDADVQVRLVDIPDPFDPDAPVGPIAAIACEPPHFLLGASGFGLSLGKFTLDFSEASSPAEVLARNQGEAWKGLYVKEAAFYLPPDTPVVGPLSLTVRDALFGIPTGMQFDAQLEWGSMGSGDARQRCGLVLQQGTATLDSSTPDVQLQQGAGPSYEVKATFTKPTVNEGESPIVGVRVNDRVLEFPIGAATTTSTTLNVLDGSQLRIAALPGNKDGDKPTTVELPEMVWTFHAPAGATTSLQAALISVQRGSQSTLLSTTSIRGTSKDLGELVLSLPGETDPATWKFGADFGAQVATQTNLNLSSFKLPLGTHMLEAKGKSRIGRVRIEIVEQGVLLVGTPTGVTPLVLSSTQVPSPPIRRALSTYALSAFLREGQLTPVGDSKASAPPLSIPQNALAEVEVDLEGLSSSTSTNPPTTSTTTPTPVRKIARRASVGFKFGSTEIQGWVWKDARETLTEVSQLDGGMFEKQLQGWLTAEPVPKEIYVVGRTDDVAWDRTLDENFKYNKDLAENRSNAIVSRIQSITSAPVYARSEFADFASTVPAPPDGVDKAHEDIDTAQWRKLVAKQSGWESESSKPVWAKALKKATDVVTYNRDIPTDEARIPYRRADIWLVYEDTSTAQTPDPATSSNTESSDSSAKFLLPGALGTNIVPVKPVAPAPKPRNEALVRLRGVWDSPVVNGLGDALPTLAEVTTRWKPKDKVQLPIKKPDGGEEAPVQVGLGTKVWQVQVRVAHDARAGSTKVTLTLDIPDDEATIEQAWVAVALALAPAIIARLDAKEGLVAMPLLLGAGYIFEQLKWVNKGKVMLHRVTTDYTDRGGRAARLACDYSVGLDEIDISLIAGVTIKGKGLVLRYNGVHVEYDWNKGDANGLHLGYDQASLSVAKAGTWKLDGPAGELLRVVGARSGVGSTWIELDLAFALNLGVIKVDGATIRVTLNGDQWSFELRGLAITVNVPKLLVGKGALKVESGGTIRGGLEIKVIPAKLTAGGSVYINSSGDAVFVGVEVAVKFATAIPLASTGLGIFGFMGRFVANGTRNLPQGVEDPVDRELQWFQLEAKDKYVPKPNQYALGLGVVVGTLPDGGTTFNAEGSLSFGFPDVSVVLGIIAHFIVPPKDVVEEGEKVQDGSAKLIGLISVDENALILGIRGSYSIPKVIDVQIPISGCFPFPKNGARDPAYLRIGADGQNKRYGQPVTVTLFPELFKVKAWAYLMIEERELHALGGREDLNFNGFSIGFGAGFGLSWGAGPLSLEASASILVGIGTKPMAIAGRVDVHGRLRLLFLTIGLDGHVTVFLSEPSSWFEAEFCAEISLFLFSIRACISFSSGKSDLPIPPPEPCPLLGVELTDARGGILATASDKSENAPVVWPDVVPVVRFSAKFADGRSAGTFPTDKPDTGPADNSPLWGGPEALQYCYRVESVNLVRIDSGADEVVAGPLPSIWWEPSHRPGVVIDDKSTPPTFEEAQVLGLLYWHPNPAWRAILTAEDLPEPLGGGPLEGLVRPPKVKYNEPDPLQIFVKQTFAGICSSSPEPTPAFARGGDAGFQGTTKVVLKPRNASPAPFPSYFELNGGRVLPGNATFNAAQLAMLGTTIEPAKIVGLAGDVVVPNCPEPLNRGVSIDHVRFHGVDMCTAAFSLLAKPGLENPTLWLAMLKESDPSERKQLHDAGMPLGRLRIAHFGCSKLGPRKHVKRGPAMIRPLRGTQMTVVDQRSWGRVAHFEYTRANPENLDLQLFGTDETFASGVSALFAVETRHVVVDVIVELVDVDSVNLRIVSVRADLQPIAIQDVTLSNSGRHRIAVNQQNIRGVVILFGRGGDWYLRGIEMRVPPWLPTDAALGKAFGMVNHDGGKKWPIVEGRRSIFHPWEEWSVEPAPQGNVQLLRATPKTPGTVFEMRIRPWNRGRLAIVGVSAISNDAREKQREDQKKRDALHDSLKDATKSPEDAAQSRFLLEPKATYRLDVTWNWIGKRSGQSAQGWDPNRAQTKHYYFRTTNIKPMPEPMVVTGQTTKIFLNPGIQGEIGYLPGVFDPRDLQRYVLGVDPDPKSPPHFRKDPLSIHFAVDYTDQLATRHGYDLVREVRRTRAAAGELNPKKNPPPMNKRLDKPLLKGPLPKHLMPAADKWIRDAVGSSPCLGPNKKPALGGHTEQHFVDLVAGGEYDFVLAAQRTSSGQLAEEVLISRTRFKVSQYDGPEHLMEALGFGNDGEGGRFYEVVVSADPVLPANGLMDDAGALEKARGVLGVSPSAGARLPRTTLLWKNASDTYSLVGVLFESDEPILRPGRIDGLTVYTKKGATTVQASRGWCDTTASVLLLWFDQAVQSPSNLGLTLNVSTLDVKAESIVKKSVTHEVFSAGKPVAALQEVF